MRHRIIVASLIVMSLATAAFAADDAATMGSASKTMAKAKPAKMKAEKAAKGSAGKMKPAEDMAQTDKSIVAIDAQIAAAKVDKAQAGWRTHLPMFKTVPFDPARTYYAQFVTNKGAVLIKLRPDVAPAHVTNLIYLARMGFYDGLKFHRVITQFMAQGGDPLGNGTGGPGYGFAGEFGGNAKHDKPGMLSMANAGPGTDGSQFFLTFLATPWLDGKHTIYGETVEGFDVLKKLEAAGSQSGQTSEPLTLDKVTISVK